MLHWLGYCFALLIGLILGLVGSGGGILAVPVLVYLFGLDTMVATVYSLFVVGISSAVAGVRYWQRREVEWHIVLRFGLPAVCSIIFTKRILLPLIPEEIGVIEGVVVTKSFLIMLLFAILVLISGFSMLKGEKIAKSTRNYPMYWLSILGLVGGLITGLMGAGGGFVIVPAVVHIGRLTMKTAMATSIVIIAFNTLLGFLGSFTSITIDWPFLLSLTTISVVGIYLGTALSSRLSNQHLKRIFGWFVLTVGLAMFIKELFFR